MCVCARALVCLLGVCVCARALARTCVRAWVYMYVSERTAKSVKYTTCVYNNTVQNISLSQIARHRAGKKPITKEKTTALGRPCWRKAPKTQRHVGVGSGEPVVVVVVGVAVAVAVGAGLDRGGECGGGEEEGGGRVGGAVEGGNRPRSGRLMDEPVGRGKVECGPAPIHAHSRLTEICYCLSYLLQPSGRLGGVFHCLSQL